MKVYVAGERIAGPKDMAMPEYPYEWRKVVLIIRKSDRTLWRPTHPSNYHSFKEVCPVFRKWLPSYWRDVVRYPSWLVQVEPSKSKTQYQWSIHHQWAPWGKNNKAEAASHEELFELPFGTKPVSPKAIYKLKGRINVKLDPPRW